MSQTNFSDYREILLCLYPLLWIVVLSLDFPTYSTSQNCVSYRMSLINHTVCTNKLAIDWETTTLAVSLVRVSYSIQFTQPPLQRLIFLEAAAEGQFQPWCWVKFFLKWAKFSKTKNNHVDFSLNKEQWKTHSCQKLRFNMTSWDSSLDGTRFNSLYFLGINSRRCFKPINFWHLLWAIRACISDISMIEA